MDTQNKKDHRRKKAMVLRFPSDSREISFRPDDCPSQAIGQLLPTGMGQVHMICQATSTIVFGQGSTSGCGQKLTVVAAGNQGRLPRLAIRQSDLRKGFLVDVDYRYTGLTGSTFRDTFDAISSVAVSPDERYLACGGSDGIIYVWHLTGYRPARTLRRHRNYVTALAFSGDSRFLAAGGYGPACGSPVQLA